MLNPIPDDVDRRFAELVEEMSLLLLTQCREKVSYFGRAYGHQTEGGVVVIIAHGEQAKNLLKRERGTPPIDGYDSCETCREDALNLLFNAEGDQDDLPNPSGR